MLSEKLKTETLSNHQQLEKKLVAQMKAIRSESDYAALLQLFYTYFGALEKRIDQYITPAILADYADRRKTEALAKDISDLGAEPSSLAPETALPPINNQLEAYGALYVIEGSTLGGKIISKMMAQQLALENNKGLSFFTGYADKSNEMWDKFKESLNLQPKSSVEEQTVIDSANETFLKFKQWFDHNQAQLS
ncbi:biliverdin-producing heme oxygenase [Mucilaginibacter aquatilis]|uniref:Heme oxygenase n=1 Tax=Mucilaginibacter aquatilis TaxID=1517760 RepID=A0A6I4IA07_9SPHI|nr:biliverdin-producing heme oxygenase [Mucilaginibacter aquatilis]MVN92040.1 heme oxygenase [Mucilaginibacter aquatilis]